MASERRKWMPIMTRVFAVIGLIATAFVVLLVVALLWMQHAAPSEPDNVVLTLDLDQPVEEQSEASPLDLAMHEDTTPLLDILHAIDSGRSDANVKGLVVRFGSTQPSLAQAEEIRSAVMRFRDSGKFIYAFASTYGDFGGGNRAYFLASAFDNIWLQPVGSVSLSSVAIEAPFARTALGKLGVSGDFLQREEYKSVMETFTRDDFSPPVRANMQSMLDDLAEQVAAGIAVGRKWDVPKVKQLMARGPYTAEEALKLGLVTHIGYADELKAEIKQKAGDDVETVDIEDYLGYGGNDSKPKPKARVALIYGTGLIADHGSGAADATGEEVMGADTVAGAFDDAIADKKIRAILFRIDSPGGSPGASETIRAVLMHAQKAGKPVFVSMGGVAASGGYWVAMNADNITAEPATLTGSIGVVAGKFVVGGLMQKLGVSWDEISTGGNGDLWSMTQPYTPAQRERMNAFIDETYHTFVKDVSDARKIPLAKMADVAKGRVFTGAQALKLGLVDQLGGYDVTLAELRKKLDLKPDDLLSIEMFPPPLSPAEKLFKLLKNIGVESAMVRVALGQWHAMSTVLDPIWSGLGNTSPVAARAPIFPILR
jgi:protease-4